MTNFLKAIVISIGGIAPGLSGSVLMVIFGLYEKIVETIGNIFKDFKKNIIFLIPIFSGFLIGVIIFSKVINYLMTNFEIYTRFAFLGLILGTVPLFNKEVRKKGFNKKYYIPMLISFIFGLVLFFFNKSLFPNITNPNMVQSFMLGLVVASSVIIPGIDSATILSALGLYGTYVSSLANLNFAVLIPAGFGLGIGILVISYFINKLLKKHYTILFSIIFGLFIAIIPSVLNETCYLAFDVKSLIALIIVIIGFCASYFLERIRA